MRAARNVLAAFAAVGAVATITLLAAHGPSSGTQSVLNPADLAATWTSPAGGSITFARDRSFVATGLRLDKVWSPCAGAGPLSVSGTWQFLDSNGDSGPGLTGYPQGSMVDLTFAGANDNPSIGCTAGFLKLTTWNVGSAPGLCVQFDPDTPCDGYIFRH